MARAVLVERVFGEVGREGVVWAIDRLSAEQLREVFGADRRWLRTSGFPDGERDGDGVRRWPADRVWEWLAAQYPEVAAVVPLRYWPRGEAVYRRAREIADGVVQDWSVHGVVLRVVWPTVAAFASGGVAAGAAELVPRVPRVIRVGHDFGLRGPSLSVHDESGRAVDVDEPAWPELALVLGGRAPYWPYGLRDGAAMRRWRPGVPAVPVAAAVDALDPVPLLRLAAALPAADTAHTVLIALARYAQHRACQDAASTIDMITGDPNMAPWVDLAATSLQVPEPGDPGEVVWRDGWLTIAARTDTLAHQAVSEVRKSRHSMWLPYTAAEYIDPTTGLGAEWSARLQPTGPYAGFEVLYDHLGAEEQDTITDYLRDPVTDAPALRLAAGNLLAAVPHRLPASSPLAAMTVGTPIWIRLADGTVHLAPRRDAPGIGWGYSGGGTSALALLITRLLDDITAPAADHVRGGAAGLEKLLLTPWPDGTTFTRAHLDTARTGQM